MSFILDALRRAQTVQNEAPSPSGPILADQIPDAPADVRQRALWFGVALLTLALVAALAWWSGRESAAPPAPAATIATPQPASPTRTTPSRTERSDVRSLDQEVARAQPKPAPAAAPPKRTGGTVTIAPDPTQAQPPASVAAAPPTPTANAQTLALPAYENLLVEGSINLPNLKMDMHVYNSAPAKRFVFINFKKYREGDTLDRKTTIEEITPRGVVMNHGGQRFLLGSN